LLTGDGPAWETTDVTLSPFISESEPANTAMALRDYVLQGRFGTAYGDVPSGVRQLSIQLRRIFFDCSMSRLDTDERAALYNAPIAMIPYLRPQELHALWAKLESGPCAGSLSPDERKWLVLFKALSKRDPTAMVSASKAILAGAGHLSFHALRYAVASGMLGHLMQGDREAAFKLWSSFRTSLFTDDRPDLLFRLLLAECTVSS
jgi:hypothetical protein